MNPTEKLTIMSMIYLISGMEAHDLPVTLRNTLGAGSNEARKYSLIAMLESRLKALNDYEKHIDDSWKNARKENEA